MACYTWYFVSVNGLQHVTQISPNEDKGLLNILVKVRSLSAIPGVSYMQDAKLG